MVYLRRCVYDRGGDGIHKSKADSMWWGHIQLVQPKPVYVTMVYRRIERGGVAH